MEHIAQPQIQIPMNQRRSFADNFKPPTWWECTWRRIGCGMADCPICSKINTYATTHNPSSNTKECLFLIQKQILHPLDYEDSADAHSRDLHYDDAIDDFDEIELPPEPHQFPLFRHIHKWTNEVRILADEAEQNGRLWVYSEAGQDLLWYITLLPLKIYRQLYNLWELEFESESKSPSPDFEYTRYIIEESTNIIERSFEQLTLMRIPEYKLLLIQYIQFTLLKPYIHLALEIPKTD